MKGFKNKKAPKQVLTAHNGEQFFVRADRKDHLQLLFGKEGLLSQLNLCPQLVRVACEASKTAEALDDVCSPRGACICDKNII